MFSRILQRLLRRFGTHGAPTSDMEPAFLDLYERCRPYTMTSIERMYALYKGVGHIVSRQVPGDIVECGVWRGGSLMLCAYALDRQAEIRRRIWVFDTFKGMTEPGPRDVRHSDGVEADPKWRAAQRESHNTWAYAPLEEVRDNLLKTGYPSDLLRFVEGAVEETIPENAPDRIALLRLDTDWHESTYHSLVHLYPRLSRNGIVIIDDYGHWRGAREAVDRYFSELEKPPMLHRIDYTGRIAVKP